MAKLSRPNLASGPLDELVRELHALHARAGFPSTREMAKGQLFSYTTVHDLFTKTTTEAPKLPVLHRVVEVLARLAPRTNVDEVYDRFDELWRAAHATPFAEAVRETEEPAASRQPDPAGLALTQELFFFADDAEPLHDLAAELRRAGFLIREQPRQFEEGGTWSLMGYSAATRLDEQDRRSLDEMAERCGAVFDGTGTYVGPPELDDGPGMRPSGPDMPPADGPHKKPV